MKRAEYIISFMMCVVGFFVFFTADLIPLMVAVEKSSVVNSRFFPKLMGVLLVVFSVILAIENYFRHPPAKIPAVGETGGKTDAPPAWKRLTLLGIMCVAYYYLFEPLGFLVSSALFMFGFSMILGARKWYIVFSLTLVSPLMVYLLFKTLLGTPLPEGVFYF